MVLRGDNGATVYAFDDATRYRCAWEASFTGSAPADAVIAAALLAADG